MFSGWVMGGHGDDDDARGEDDMMFSSCCCCCCCCGLVVGFLRGMVCRFEGWGGLFEVVCFLQLLMIIYQNRKEREREREMLASS